MEKLEPSKENCREALRRLKDLNSDYQVTGTEVPENVVFLQRFLEAAERKLPAQAAIDRDRLRRKRPVDQ